jgi:hypothetical protein
MTPLGVNCRQQVLGRGRSIDALADLDVKPPLLITGLPGPWAAVLRLR